jgi:hypothetical protein
MDYEIQMMKFANEKDISLDKVKAMLASDAAKLKLQKYLADRDGVSDEIVSPPTEPTGKAQPGRSFQQ